MHTFHYALLIAALVCAILAAFQLSTPRVNLIAMALALFFASLLLTGCGFVNGVKQSDTASYTTKSGIDYACPHDGKHGDEVTITVEHNGKKAAQTVASAQLFEKDTDFIGEVAVLVFNDTK